jgi:hypothetical protein
MRTQQQASIQHGESGVLGGEQTVSCIPPSHKIGISIHRRFAFTLLSTALIVRVSQHAIHISSYSASTSISRTTLLTHNHLAHGTTSRISPQRNYYTTLYQDHYQHHHDPPNPHQHPHPHPHRRHQRVPPGQRRRRQTKPTSVDARGHRMAHFLRRRCRGSVYLDLGVWVSCQEERSGVDSERREEQAFAD